MPPATYSKAQVEEYFDRIRLPAHLRRTAVADGPEALEFLTTLQQHHVVAIPFENLSLHYGPGQVNLHPDALYHKVIHGQGNGRGGYCMENNLPFATLLRTLGFRLYSAGARVAQGPAGYWGFGHMINIVTINGQKYLVDVGFGGNGPIRPLPLNKGEEVFGGIAPSAHRLVWKNIAENTDPDQRLWVLEHRNDDVSAWEGLYCYSELEFLAGDYQIMNYFTSTSRHIFFTQQVICVRMVFGREVHLDEEGDQIVGVYILQQQKFKVRVHGKVERTIEIGSEEERLQVLKEYFGIEFTEGERAAINGLPSAIAPGLEM